MSTIQATFQNVEAQLWWYSVSLGRIAIRLHVVATGDEQFILGYGCRTLALPTSWSVGLLEIVRVGDSETLIEDKPNMVKIDCAYARTQLHFDLDSTFIRLDA